MEKEIQHAWKILLDECGEHVSASDAVLLKRAVETIYGNLIVLQEGTPVWGSLRSFAPALSRYVGHWNWDSAFYAMALLKWDATLAREQAEILFSAQHENGCLSNVIFPDGRNVTNRSQPPIWFWAYREIDEAHPDDASLARAYDVLTKHEGFWTARRCADGLFYYDVDGDKNPYYIKFESGWDTSPRWDAHLPSVLWPIDLNCYMVLAYRSLCYMANRLDKPDEAERWQSCELALARRINERLWHKEQGAYYDTVIENGRPTEVLTPASLLPLFVGIADQEQAQAMAALAMDETKLYPLMPSVAYDAPSYASGDYFRGPTWLNIAYMAVVGLERYGYTELADGFRDRILNVCAAEQRGLFEYYDSRTGEGRGACGYGWTAVFIIKWILARNGRADGVAAT